MIMDYHCYDINLYWRWYALPVKMWWLIYKRSFWKCFKIPTSVAVTHMSIVQIMVDAYLKQQQGDGCLYVYFSSLIHDPDLSKHTYNRFRTRICLVLFLRKILNLRNRLSLSFLFERIDGISVRTDVIDTFWHEKTRELSHNLNHLSHNHIILTVSFVHPYTPKMYLQEVLFMLVHLKCTYSKFCSSLYT